MAQGRLASRALSSRPVIPVLAATILLLFDGSLAGQQVDADSARPRLRLAADIVTWLTGEPQR